jgi:hypothetical protein
MKQHHQHLQIPYGNFRAIVAKDQLSLKKPE